jgi:uncharacterized membrane protein
MSQDWLGDVTMRSGFWTSYIAIALPFWLLDAVWLGLIAKRFYRDALGPLMAKPVKAIPAVLFYIAYPAGLALFVLGSGLAPNIAHAAAMGGLFGLFCYGTYDLVNHATLQGWPLRLTVVDMAWGTFASAAACAVARAIVG